MTPGDAYRVGVARPRKPATRPVVVSHRPIVNSNLPVSYLCIQPERGVAAIPTCKATAFSRRLRE